MIKKISFIFLLTLIIALFLYPIHTVQAISIKNVMQNADKAINSAKANAENLVDYNIINDASDFVYNTLVILGTGIAAIVGAVLGFQFITGSVEQKVKVKESLIPFLIGCIVIFGAFGIWRLVIVIMRDI